jgi:hypothetical protein
LAGGGSKTAFLGRKHLWRRLRICNGCRANRIV